MSDDSPNNDSLNDACFNIWMNWTVGVGSLVVPMAAALFMQPKALPFLLFAEVCLLLLFRQSRCLNGLPVCRLLPRLSWRILACSMLLMVAIILLCTDHLFPKVIRLHYYNEEIPFVASLVILPCSVVVCSLYLFAGLMNSHCRHCRRRNNIYDANAFIANCYHREARKQTHWLLSASAALCTVLFCYYLLRYTNASINAQDRFFFSYLPLAAYLVSLPLMARRYARMYSMFAPMADGNPGRTNTTRVRFLIICDNKLLLQRCNNGLFDTPCQSMVDFSSSISEEYARRLLERVAGMSDAELRYCYTCNALAPRANTILFAAFVDSPERYSREVDDPQWCSAAALSVLARDGVLVNMMACELQRLSVATMAWKTYDATGRRRYPIKHYRPSFCLNDIRRCDVNYDDTRWPAVADDNEDRLSYRIRTWWCHLSSNNPLRKTS